MPDLRRQHESGDALCRYLRDDLGVTRVALAFSRGKDALCAWWQLRRHGFEVVPYHLDLVPGMSFVEESLAYYDRVLGAKVVRYVHPGTFRMLRDLVYQPPERWPVILEADLPDVTRQVIDDDVRATQGVEWIATGVRAADSILRLAGVRHHGSLNPKARTFMPVFDWRMDRVYRCLDDLAAEGIGLPLDYELFGRTFDGVDAKFTAALRERLPADYQRVLDLFPLADADLFRRDHQ
jgi:hypothetical protein